MKLLRSAGAQTKSFVSSQTYSDEVELGKPRADCPAELPDRRRQASDRHGVVWMPFLPKAIVYGGRLLPLLLVCPLPSNLNQTSSARHHALEMWALAWTRGDVRRRKGRKHLR